MATDRAINRAEKHVLDGYPECKVEVNDDGSVEVWVAYEMMTVDRLSEIVAFVESHGQVTVCQRQHDD